MSIWGNIRRFLVFSMIWDWIFGSKRDCDCNNHGRYNGHNDYIYGGHDYLDDIYGRHADYSNDDIYHSDDYYDDYLHDDFDDFD